MCKNFAKNVDRQHTAHEYSWEYMFCVHISKFKQVLNSRHVSHTIITRNTIYWPRPCVMNDIWMISRILYYCTAGHAWRIRIIEVTSHGTNRRDRCSSTRVQVGSLIQQTTDVLHQHRTNFPTISKMWKSQLKATMLHTCHDTHNDTALSNRQQCILQISWLTSLLVLNAIMQWFNLLVSQQTMKHTLDKSLELRPLRSLVSSVLGHLGLFKGPKWPGNELTKDRSALTTSALWTDLSTAKNTTLKDNKGQLWGWFVTDRSCIRCMSVT